MAVSHYAVLSCYIAAAGYELFFMDDDNNNEDDDDDAGDDDDESDSDEDCGGDEFRVPIRTTFMEDVVDCYSMQQFRQNFRMNRSTFTYLCELLGPRIMPSNYIARMPPVPVRKQIMVALWILANAGPFRTVADMFGIVKSTARHCLLNVCNALVTLNKEEKIISWPKGERAKKISQAFQAQYGFPGVVGAIDVMHVKIPKHKKHPAIYLNGKNKYSIILQGVCDDEFLFTDCYIGEAGSISNACVFGRSDLGAQMRYEKGANMFEDESTHIIGDASYPILPHLIVPFRDHGYLTTRQQRFNMLQSSARCVIRQAFLLLTRRLRKLKFLEMSKVELMPIVVLACCILHNLCILQDDYADDFSASDSEESDDGCECFEEEELDDDEEREDDGGQSQRDLGREKRDSLASQL